MRTVSVELDTLIPRLKRSKYAPEGDSSDPQNQEGDDQQQQGKEENETNKERKERDKREAKEKREEIFKKLFTADKNASDHSKFVFEHPFTFLGLKSMERMRSLVKASDFKDITKDYSDFTPRMCQELSLQILPFQDTLYHYIGENLQLS